MSDRDVAIRITAVGPELADRLRLEARFLSDVLNLKEVALTMLDAADALETRWRPVSDAAGLRPGHFYLTCNDHYRLCDSVLYSVQGKWQRYAYADAYPTHWTEWPMCPWEQK